LSESKPPLRARLHWYKLDVFEFAVLTAMCEHDWKGLSVWPSIARLAAYSKLSERKVQYVIRRLRDRGLVSELAPGSSTKRRPTTYRINEEAFEADPRMSPYCDWQIQLPGIRRPGVPGEPINREPMASTPGAYRAPVRSDGCTSGTGWVHIVRGTGAHCAPDSLIDSPLDSETTPKPPAATFQDSIELQLKQAGYETEREVPVPDRGDGSGGRIDLVARRGSEVIAVECDSGRPRQKSEIKLLAFPATQRFIVLRDPAGGFRNSPALQALIPGPCVFGRCDGSGLRASYSTPGRSVPCDCRREQA
jgi:hypothetical protein